MEKVYERQSKALFNLRVDVQKKEDKIEEMSQKVQAEKLKTKQKE